MSRATCKAAGASAPGRRTAPRQLLREVSRQLRTWVVQADEAKRVLFYCFDRWFTPEQRDTLKAYDRVETGNPVYCSE